MTAKEQAFKTLSYLRKGVKRHHEFESLLREQLKKAGLSLVCIGTSEEELEALRVYA